MKQGAPAAFFSYRRSDSKFALRLAKDLKAAGANVWLDQLDIEPGQRWARAVQDALTNCLRVLVVLSPSSVESPNVQDEIAFALEEKKTVIPVFYRDCRVPLQLRGFHYADFRADYTRSLKALLKTLGIRQQAEGISDTPSQDTSEADTSAQEERRQATEAPRRAAEQANQEREQAARQERLEQERTPTTASAPAMALAKPSVDEIFDRDAVVCIPAASAFAEHATPAEISAIVARLKDSEEVPRQAARLVLKNHAAESAPAMIQAVRNASSNWDAASGAADCFDPAHEQHAAKDLGEFALSNSHDWDAQRLAVTSIGNMGISGYGSLLLEKYFSVRNPKSPLEEKTATLASTFRSSLLTSVAGRCTTTGVASLFSLQSKTCWKIKSPSPSEKSGAVDFRSLWSFSKRMTTRTGSNALRQ